MDASLGVSILGREGKGENQFAQPRGVCINNETKELFIVDCNNHRIQTYHLPSLAYIRQIGKGVQGHAPGCLMFPVGICMDDSQQLYVSDTNNHRIVVFNHITGCFVRTIGAQGSGVGCLNSPYGICLDAATGLLFVADYDNNRVQVFDKDSGEFVRVIGQGFGVAPGKFSQPIGVCIDQDTGYLYVADYANDRVQVLHKESGQHIHTIAPVDGDAFNGPRSLCINRPAGLLFISDRENHRIQVYDKATWQFIRHIGSGLGQSPGQFNRPMDICTDNDEGVLVVVDGYNHRVQILELEELQKEKRRLRALKKSKQSALSLVHDVVEPSHIAITATIAQIDSAPALAESGMCVAKFACLGPAFDMPLRVGDLGESAHALRTIESDEPHFSSRLNRPPLSPASAPSSSSSSSAATTSTAMATLLPGGHNIPGKGSIEFQGAAFLDVLENLAAQPLSDSLLFLVSPSLLALQSLIARGWVPGHVSTQLLDLILFLIQRVTAASVNQEEGDNVFGASVEFLKTCIKQLTSARDHVIAWLPEFLKTRKDLVGELRYDGQALYRRSVTLSLLDLLKQCLERSDPDFARAALLTQASGSSASGAEDLSAEAKLYREVATMIFGAKLCDAVNLLHSQFQASSSAKKAGVRMNQNASKMVESRMIAASSIDLGDLLDLLQSVRCAEQSPGEGQPSIAQQREALFSLFSDIVLGSLHDAGADKFHGDAQRRRGGRSIWMGDRPLMVGDLVDCMDKEKSWFESLVLEVHPHGSIKVHFLGWGSKWDDTISPSDVEARVAPLNSYTRNWRADLFEGGLIEVKCNDDLVNQKWMWGRITRINSEEEWVEVSYSLSNEPAVVKKAWLYGETICPVGMHTKDKSKSASTGIVRPAKTANDILRERVAQPMTTDDELFLDSEDDHHFDDAAHESPTSLFCSTYYDQPSPSGSNTEELHSLSIVAQYIFQSVMKCLTASITEKVLQQGGAMDNSWEGFSTASSAFKSVRTLAKSPWKHLLSAFLLRPIYVHAGVQAKLLASSYRETTQEEYGTRVLALAARLERLQALYSVTVSSLLNGVVSATALTFVLRRLSKTVDCCGFSSITNDLIYTFHRNPLYLTQLFQPLVSPERFQAQHRQLRNLFRGLISATGPSLSQKLLSMVEEHLLFTPISSAVQEISQHSEGADPRCSVLFANKLLDQLVSVRAVLGSQILPAQRGRFAAERALILSTDRLDSEQAQKLGVALAVALHTSVNADRETASSPAYNVAEDLVAAVMNLTNEEVWKYFKSKYLSLLLEDLLDGHKTVGLAERALLHNLPHCEDILRFVDELDAAKLVRQQFCENLLEVVDNGKLLDRSVLQMAVQSEGINVTVLSAHRWAPFLRSVCPMAALPASLECLRKEFELFFEQGAGEPRVRLIWCIGRGKVTMAVKVGQNYLTDIVVDELQCSVLMSLQSGKKRISDLCQICNVDADRMIAVVKSLAHGGAFPGCTDGHSHRSTTYQDDENSRGDAGNAAGRNVSCERDRRSPSSRGLLTMWSTSLDGQQQPQLRVEECDLSTWVAVRSDLSPTTQIQVDPYWTAKAAQESHGRVQRWRNDLIEAALVKVLKTMHLSGMGKRYVSAEPQSALYASGIIIAAIRYLHERHRQSLFTVEEVSERFGRLVACGYLEEAGVHSLHRPPERQSPVRRLPSQPYGAASRPAISSPFSILPPSLSASATEASSPPALSPPLAPSVSPLVPKRTVAIFGAALETSERSEASTSLATLRRKLLETVLAEHRGDTGDVALNVDAIYEMKDEPIALLTPTMCTSGLIACVARKPWRVRLSSHSMEVQSVSPADPMPMATNPLSESASYSSWLKPVIAECRRSLALALGALLTQTNLLLHQFHCASKGLHAMPPLFPIDGALARLSTLATREDEEWESLFLVQFLSSTCGELVSEYGQFFRSCISERSGDELAMEQLNEIINAAKRGRDEDAPSSSDFSLLWSHEFQLRLDVQAPEPRWQGLFRLLCTMRLDDGGDTREVVEGKDDEEDESVSKRSTAATPIRMSFGALLELVFECFWEPSQPQERHFKVDRAPPLDTSSAATESSGSPSILSGSIRPGSSRPHSQAAAHEWHGEVSDTGAAWRQSLRGGVLMADFSRRIPVLPWESQLELPSAAPFPVQFAEQPSIDLLPMRLSPSPPLSSPPSPPLPPSSFPYFHSPSTLPPPLPPFPASSLLYSVSGARGSSRETMRNWEQAEDMRLWSALGSMPVNLVQPASAIPVESYAHSMDEMLEMMVQTLHACLARGLGHSGTTGRRAGSSIVTSAVRMTALDSVFQQLRPENARLLWWCPISERQSLGGALTAAFENISPLLSPNTLPQPHNSPMPASEWTVSQWTPNMIDSQGEYKQLVSSLAEITALHWTLCSSELQRCLLDVDAFFESLFPSGDLSGQSDAGWVPFFAPAVNSADSCSMCPYCQQSCPMVSFRALACGHYACQDCWRTHLTGHITLGSSRVPCICRSVTCEREGDFRFVDHVVRDKALLQVYLQNLFTQHERAFNQRVTWPRPRMPCRLHRKTMLCDLCRPFEAWPEIGSESAALGDHRVAVKRATDSLRAIDAAMVTAGDASQFHSLVGQRRVWQLYADCVAVMEHVRQGPCMDVELLERFKARLSEVQENSMNSARQISVQMFMLRHMHNVLMGMAHQQRAMGMTSFGSQGEECRFRLACPGMLAPEQLSARSPFSRQQGQGSHSARQQQVLLSKEGVGDEMAFAQPCMQWSMPVPSQKQRDAQPFHQAENRAECLEDLFAALGDPLSDSPGDHCQHHLRSIIHLLTTTNWAACMLHDSHLYWSTICRFSERLNMLSPESTKLVLMVMNAFILGCQGQGQDVNFPLSCWKKLQSVLQGVLSDDSVVVHVARLLHTLFSGSKAQCSQYAAVMREIDLRAELVEIIETHSGQSSIVVPLALVMIRSSVVSPGTTGAVDEATCLELRRVLHIVCAAYADVGSGLPSHGSEGSSNTSGGGVLERDEDHVLFELAEKLFPPMHAHGGVADSAQQGLLPLAGLRRLAILLQEGSTHSPIPTICVHRVCSAMICLSSALHAHKEEVGLTPILVDILRTISTADMTPLLFVCSALSKLIIGLCAREGRWREVFRESELVQVLKEKKMQVVSLALAQGEAYDLKSQCNKVSFTITSAIQSIMCVETRGSASHSPDPMS